MNADTIVHRRSECVVSVRCYYTLAASEHGAMLSPVHLPHNPRLAGKRPVCHQAVPRPLLQAFISRQSGQASDYVCLEATATDLPLQHMAHAQLKKSQCLQPPASCHTATSNCEPTGPTALWCIAGRERAVAVWWLSRCVQAATACPGAGTSLCCLQRASPCSTGNSKALCVRPSPTMEGAACLTTT